MKWILPILLSVAVTCSYGQSKDSVVSLPKSHILKLANKIQNLQDTIHWQRDTIVWQKGIIVGQDTLISSHKQRSLLFQEQLDNRQQAITLMEQENKKLRETIDLLMPKWYDNKWLWFGSGAAVATIILSAIH